MAESSTTSAHWPGITPDAGAWGGEVLLAYAAAGDAHGEHAVAHDGAHEAAGHGHDYARAITHPPEPPHFIQLWFYKDYKKIEEEGGDPYGNPNEGLTIPQVLHVGPIEKPLPLFNYLPWENHVFFAIGALVLVLASWLMTRSFRRDRREAMRRPTRSQLVVEMIVDGFDNFVRGILGDENGRKYMPFIGTMFMLILVFNLMGLVPLMKAPSASLIITLSLALTTFLFTQYTAWVRLGPLTYLHHLCGSPTSAVQWCLAPLLIVLEMISDFVAKPLSLALRLFGNVLGKDILLGSFLFMGISLAGAVAGPLAQYVGVPLTVPFYFLGILLGVIQALVFATLSCIYIMLVLPHDYDHGDDHGHEHDGHGAEAHAH